MPDSNVVYIKAYDYLKQLLDYPLKKELCDNEEICEKCKGTGLIAVDSPYYTKDDQPSNNGMTWHSRQSLSFCPNCFHGIVKRCRFCGKIIPKHRLKCDCKEQQDLDELEYKRRESEKIERIPELSDDELLGMEYMYSDYYPYDNGFFSDWDDFFSEYFDNLEIDYNDDRPLYVFPTKPVEMRIDAESIVDNALEDMYEDARDYISDKAIEELQEYLDKWCAKCGVGLSYECDKSHKIRIPWNEYEHEYLSQKCNGDG